MDSSDDDSDDISDNARVTWMDMYIVYSAATGVVAFMTGAVRNWAVLSIWGIWTFCAIAYFARDRQTWSYKCDVAIIAAALPIAVRDKYGLFQFIAGMQIAVHVCLLVEHNYRWRMQAIATSSTESEATADDDDSDCIEM